MRAHEQARKWLLLDLLGAIAGIAGGLDAIVFRLTLEFNHWLFFDLLLPNISFYAVGFNWSYIILQS
jgi:hypothetical protein